MAVNIIDVNTVFGLWPRRPVDISIDSLFGLMKRHGVSRACSVSARGIFYDATMGNDETHSVSARHPEILPAATLNFAAYLGWEDEMRLRLDQGFRVFRFFPSVQEWSICGKAFRRFVDEISDYPSTLLVVPAAEGMLNIADILGGVPNPVIITSFRYTHLSEAIEAMLAHTNLYVETHQINSPDFLHVLADHVGLDRVIYGSNAPLSYMGSALLPILNSEITEAQKQAVLGGNLEHLLEANAQ